ncbi:MAG: hypothetical protein B7Z55_10745, partial [Planctomycetales bacterium 12-60-4]
ELLINACRKANADWLLENMFCLRSAVCVGFVTLSTFLTASTLHSQVVPTTASTFLQGSDEYPEVVGETDLLTRMQVMESQSVELREKIKTLEEANKRQDAAKSKLPSVTINGVFQADAAAFGQDDDSRDAYGRVEGGGDFRRARLSAKGAVTDRMDCFMQMDVAFFGRPTFTDLWVDFKDAGPLGTVRVGQWKQPFSLEVVSSFRYTTFMERAGTFQAFTPFRHLWIGFYDNSDDLNWTWAASYFRTGQDQFGGSLSTDGGNGLAGRFLVYPSGSGL